MYHIIKKQKIKNNWKIEPSVDIMNRKFFYSHKYIYRKDEVNEHAREYCKANQNEKSTNGVIQYGVKTIAQK